MNASPDLRAQIGAYTDLQPDFNSIRNTPIEGVLLTNADLDHVLGLFSLREGGQLTIYATSAVKATATSCLGLTAVLDVFCGTVWREPSVGAFVPLVSQGESTSSVLYRAICLPGERGHRKHRGPALAHHHGAGTG